MTKPAKAVPEGFHTVTPYLTIRGAAKAVEFYKKAFGAEQLLTMPGPGGKLMHAEIKIGDSFVMLGDDFPEMGGPNPPTTLGGTCVTIHLYVPDVDAAVDRATKAGAKLLMPVQDMFWGDRYGVVEDPFGHRWGVATHKEDLTPEEIARRAKAAGF